MTFLLNAVCKKKKEPPKLHTPNAHYQHMISGIELAPTRCTPSTQRTDIGKGIYITETQQATAPQLETSHTFGSK